MMLTRYIRWVVAGLLLATALVGSAQTDGYEAKIQQVLTGIYTGDDRAAGAAIAELRSQRPDFPASMVYQALLDSWRAADDPLNETAVKKFEQDSDTAIAACLKWTHDHPTDAEGWRYLASAYGQRAAMLLAGAYWSEGDYKDFQNTIARISSKYPGLASVRAWQVEGWICSSEASKPWAGELIRKAQADEGWKELQQGRVALAEGNAHDSAELFLQAATSPDANFSVRTMACKGLAESQRILHSSATGSANCKQIVLSDEISQRAFPVPGRCRH